MIEIAQATFPARADAVRSARQLVAEHLNALGLQDPDDADLVITELATNAVIHARTAFRVRLLVATGSARIEVSDESSTLPAAGTLNPLALSGRGLTLVQAVSLRWGAERRSPKGKTVWCELASPATGSDTLALHTLESADDEPLTEAGIDARLVRWDDLDGPLSNAAGQWVEVTIPDVSVDELLGAKVQMEDLLREVQMMLIAHPNPVSGRPHVREIWPAARELDDAAAAFSEGRRQVRALAVAARARHQRTITLRLRLPTDAAVTAQRYQRAIIRLQHILSSDCDPQPLTTVTEHGEGLGRYASIRQLYLDMILRQWPLTR